MTELKKGGVSACLNTGAVGGLFTLFGAIGISFATKIGGLLFDAWTPAAPFIITGIVNGVITPTALTLIGMGLHKRSTSNFRLIVALC